MTPKDAQHRLTILQFFTRYGQAATCEAFGISRRTRSRWKRGLTQAAGDPQALVARSRATSSSVSTPAASPTGGRTRAPRK